MFDKFKQLGQLAKMRQQAIALQKELEKVVETIEKNGWIVSVSGDQKVRYIKRSDTSSLLDEKVLKHLTDAVNEAMKKVQKEAAKKMMEMGGGLTGLLGGMK